MKLICLWSLLGVSGTWIESGHDAFWSLSDGPAVALCLLIWYQIMTCDALWHMKAIIPSSINSEIPTGKRSFFREHNLARGHDECACSSSNFFEDITEQACTYFMNALPEA